MQIYLNSNSVIVHENEMLLTIGLNIGTQTSFVNILQVCCICTSHVFKKFDEDSGLLIIVMHKFINNWFSVFFLRFAFVSVLFFVLAVCYYLVLMLFEQP